MPEQTIANCESDPRVSYLVVDTEGSGLFDYKLPADGPGQPRLAAITMLFCDADLKLTGEYHAYVKPEGWAMTEGATKVNGLTDEFLAANGVPVIQVLDCWAHAILIEERTVIAHNAVHDLKQVRAELRRSGRPDLFEWTKNICTMRALTNVCKIPPRGGRGGYKWPSLSEACVFFHFDQFGDHSAKNDAMACYMLARKLAELGLLTEGEVHFAKEKPAAPTVKHRPDSVNIRAQSLAAGLQASAATVANENDGDF